MRHAILPSILLLAACSTGGGASAEEGSATKRSYDLAGFDRIDLAGDSNVVVRAGPQVSVSAQGSDEALDRLEIKVAGGTLQIGQKRRLGLNFARTRPATIYVAAPSVVAASISGSGDIDLDQVHGPAFAGSVGGSGNIGISSLRVQEGDFSIAGSGGIKARGEAQTVKLDIAGSGTLDLSALESRTAEVSIAGSGNAHARAMESADISIAGSGDAIVSGPAKCTISTVGSGRARCGA